MAAKNNVPLLILILFAVIITFPSPSNTTTVTKPHSTSPGVARGGHHPGRPRLNNRKKKPITSIIPGVATAMALPVDLLKKKNKPRRAQQPPRVLRQTTLHVEPNPSEIPPDVVEPSSGIVRNGTLGGGGGPYGENLFWGSGNRWRAVDAVQNWAMEHHYYDPSKNSFLQGRMCRHYTRIVWRSSTTIRCARVKCRRGGVAMICNYDPLGNYVGENPFQPTS